MISNCSIDERGKISGGKAGDNNGKEWLIRSWYSYPWNYVLRPNNDEARQLIAQMAEAAAKNNNIGYNQLKRTTFWKQLQAVGYKPEDIKTACDADCSAAVAAIVKAVGYRLNIKAYQGVSINCYTGNLRSALKNAGFTVLTDSKYLTSDKYLLAGDVLLKEGRHTCINLTNGSKATVSASTSTSITLGTKPTVKEWQLAAMADGFKFPKYGADGEWGAECESVAKKAIIKKRVINKYSNLTKLLQKYLGADIDGKCGNNTTALIKSYQTKVGLEPDGVCGLNTWRSIIK